MPGSLPGAFDGISQRLCQLGTRGLMEGMYFDLSPRSIAARLTCQSVKAHG
jgi:hypothetical protein